MHIYWQFFTAADLFYPFTTALVAACLIGLTLAYSRSRPRTRRRPRVRQSVDAWLVGLTLVYSLLHPQKERRQHARHLLNDLLKRRNRH